MAKGRAPSGSEATVAPRSSVMPPGVLVLLAAVTLLWGANWPAMKAALFELPPWTFRTICLFGSGPTLLLLTLLTGHSIRIPAGRLRPLLVVAAFNITGWHLSTAYGLLHIESGRAAIIAFTMPVWAAIFAVWVLGERLEPRRVMALVLGIGSVLVLIGPDLDQFGATPLGAALMISGAIFWAAGTVAIKTVEWRMPVMALTGWQIVIGGIPVAIGRWMFEPWPDVFALQTTTIVATLYATLVAMVFCFCAFIKIVTMVPAGVAGISTLAIPIVGLYSSALLLGEPAGLREFAALVLVVGALGLVLLPRRSGARGQTPA